MEVREVDGEGARQMIKVSLSWSRRQDCCIACSEARGRGVDAVAFWISWAG